MLITNIRKKTRRLAIMTIAAIGITSRTSRAFFVRAMVAGTRGFCASTTIVGGAGVSRRINVGGRKGDMFFAPLPSSSLHYMSTAARDTDTETETTENDADFDRALDEILGKGLLDGVEDPVDLIVGSDNTSRVVKATPLSSSFLKEFVDANDEDDFKNPKFLSTSNPQWTEAGVPQSIIDVLSHKGITHFTPVQAKAIRPVLAGRDVIGRSRTGTGKTLAFGIPAMMRLVKIAKQKGDAEVLRDGSMRMKRGRLPGMIVMCPTRELARQVEEELSVVCKPLGLFSAVFHGGVSYEPQVRFHGHYYDTHSACLFFFGCLLHPFLLTAPGTQSSPGL